jgi:hypothetical protein
LLKDAVGDPLIGAKANSDRTNLNVSFIIVILFLLAAAALFAAVRYGASKYLLLMCGILNLTGCARNRKNSVTVRS